MKGFGSMRINKKLMPEQIHINLARIKKNGRNFEIVIDPDKAVAFRNGLIDDVREVLMAEKIFEDAKKGLFSPETDLKTTFGTLDAEEIAEYILRKGELQLSAKYREKQREEKTRKILEIIHRITINPTNNLPHPIIRLENALEEAKIKIDEKKSAEDQVQEVIKKLKKVLPIKQENKYVHIHLSEAYAKKYFKNIHNYGRLIKEEWLQDNTYSCILEIPSGIYLDLVEDLSKKTHGAVDIKVLSEKDLKYYQ
ncbi:MAG: ribosome assembly factor SBDS [Candidatus Woesearchaeota archaeon]